MLRRFGFRLNDAVFKSSFVFNRATSSVPVGPLYKFTEEEEMLKDTVKRLANDVVKPRVSAMDEAGKLDDSIIKTLFDNGLMGIEIPAKYGGAEAGFFSSILAIEELAKVDPSTALIVDVQNTLSTNAFFKWANEEQKARYLPRLATDTVAAYCLSEASSGSDAFALKTTAKKEGNHYVLNGTKLWITNAKEAGLFLVFANVKPEAGYRGITCFLVEKAMPGVSLGSKEKKLGIRASSNCPVMLDDVKVPEENVLGAVGKGYMYAIRILNEGRIGIGAQLIGLAQGAFDVAVDHCKERQQFGRALIEFQAMQHQMAEIATEIEAARLLVYNAARIKQAAEAAGDFSGNSFIYQAAMGKYFASQIAQRASSCACDWMGGLGFIRADGGASLATEKFYRDSKVGTIYEGTTNMQLNTIAKFIIDGQIRG